MFAVADCELLGRQVGIATATDEVEDTNTGVVSVMPEEIWRKVNVMIRCFVYSLGGFRSKCQ